MGPQVRRDDLSLGLAAEEQDGVRLRVVERDEPLVRRQRRHVAATPRVGLRQRAGHVSAAATAVTRRPTSSTYVPISASSTSSPRVLQNLSSIGSGCNCTAHERSGAAGLARDGAGARAGSSPEPVAEEEQVARLQHRRDRTGNEIERLGVREVVDVVVLRDHERLEVAIGRGPAVDASVDLEDHGLDVRRDVVVVVRALDQDRLAVRRHVPEPRATVLAGLYATRSNSSPASANASSSA